MSCFLLCCKFSLTLVCSTFLFLFNRFKTFDLVSFFLFYTIISSTLLFRLSTSHHLIHFFLDSFVCLPSNLLTLWTIEIYFTEDIRYPLPWLFVSQSYDSKRQWTNRMIVRGDIRILAQKIIEYFWDNNCLESVRSVHWISNIKWRHPILKYINFELLTISIQIDKYFLFSKENI